MRKTTCRRAGIVGVLVGAMAISGAPAASAYVISSGDTLSGIAARHRVSTRALMDANGIDDPDHIVQGATLVIPTASGGTTSVSHVVQPGETLSSIAARYGVSTTALAQANGITDPDRIRSGSRLAVGAGGSSSGATSSGSSSSSSSSTSGSSVQSLISAAARRHGWRPAIPLGLAMQESGWNNSVVSSAGARGIMQVMPTTGEWVGRYLLKRSLDLGDPADNVAAGMAYLDYLYTRFDRDIERTLAAYYEGPRRVQENGPSAGGRRYAANVLALADRYR